MSERDLTDAEREAIQKLADAVQPMADGNPVGLMEIHETCCALGELQAALGAEHPEVFRLRRELKKAGLSRPPRRNSDV